MKLKKRPSVHWPSPRRPIIFIAAAALFLCGVAAHAPVKAAVSSVSHFLKFSVKRVVARLTTHPRQLLLDIPHEGMMRLAFVRQSALKKGVLLTGPQDFVSGRIRSGEASVRAKLRLKGDWTDHLHSDQWSFRIRLKRGEALFGLREFSIQHPGTREYLNEWFYHAALERENVLSPRYGFVEVTLNGRELGVYAFEEHFEKRLVESARRREGPILKFSEDDLWEERARLYPHFEPSVWGANPEILAPIEAFKSSSTLQSPVLREAFVKASALLQGFRSGSVKAEDAFDLERFASFLAVSNLLGANHALIWHNLWFYFDPVSGRMEPIAYDGDAGKTIGLRLKGPAFGRFWERMFESSLFVAAYVKKLEEVSKPEYLKSLLAETEETRNDNLRILHRDFPEVDFEGSVFETNRRRLAAAVDPARSVHVYFQGASNGVISLKAANIQGLPVEILGLLRPDGGKDSLSKPFLLKPGDGEGAVEYQDVLIPGRGDAQAYRLAYRFFGSPTFRTTSVYPWTYPDASKLEDQLTSAQPNPGSFPFIRRDGAGYRIGPGRHVFKKSLVIGPNSKLSISPGARIEFAKGASILSRSPLEAIGRENAPIVFLGREGGSGILVLANGKQSRLHYTRFENLSPPSNLATGAVTFQDSPVVVLNSEFIGARAEDALNLIRSTFEIKDTLFLRAAGDALDADFSNGSITDTMFSDSGNDGIDASGSGILLERVSIQGAGDKGVSAGEMSRLRARTLTVRGAAIGVASKDISVFTIEDAELIGCKVGLAAYQKKPEFGPGEIRASGIKIEAEQSVSVQSGSRIFLEGHWLGENGS